MNKLKLAEIGFFTGIAATGLYKNYFTPDEAIAGCISYFAIAPQIADLFQRIIFRPNTQIRTTLQDRTIRILFTSYVIAFQAENIMYLFGRASHLLTLVSSNYRRFRNTFFTIVALIGLTQTTGRETSFYQRTRNVISSVTQSAIACFFISQLILSHFSFVLYDSPQAKKCFESYFNNEGVTSYTNGLIHTCEENVGNWLQEIHPEAIVAR